MRAMVFDTFSGPIDVAEVDEPTLPRDGVIVAVDATGVCKSDWNGWRGTDPDIRLPHVGGHELAGTIIEVAPDVRGWSIGDRVTVPFACGCGACRSCTTGRQNLCDDLVQIGFTQWGSFAERVALPRASLNLVRLPDAMTSIAAASLGCRFATAYRAVLSRGGVRPGQWLAVHGCGGVGLSAVMVAAAAGANVVAIDTNRDALRFATTVGASVTLDANANDDVVAALRDVTGGGADVSIDAVGSATAIENSLRCLRRGGRHVQVGIVPPHSSPQLLARLIVRRELDLVGSLGMPVHDYAPMMELVVRERLRPDMLVSRVVALEDAPTELASLGDAAHSGITVVDMSMGVRPS